MAKKFDVSVSKSSIGMFDECPRMWLINTRFWLLGPEIAREGRYQKRLMGQFALVGQLVDDMITYLLRRYEKNGAWESDLERGARNLLDQYLAESRDWRKAYDAHEDRPAQGRRQPLESAFYGATLDEAERASIILQTLALVDAWRRSEAFKLIESYPVADWRTPATSDHGLPSFMHGPVEVWSKYDFAIHSADATLIFDWKTGKVSPESEEDVRDQLHTYAKFAMMEWGAKPEALKLYAVWLAVGAEECLQEYPFEPDRLQRLEAIWSDRYALLTERLDAAGRDVEALLEAFPMTSQRWRCRNCRFRVCEGYRQANGAQSPEAL